MRDMVEIGMGRTARRTYELDDINIVPSRRTRSSQDVTTTWQLDAYRFEIPVVSHPTDAQALTPALVTAGIDLLIIQGTIISAERIAQGGEPLNLKTFISELDVPVVA